MNDPKAAAAYHPHSRPPGEPMSTPMNGINIENQVTVDWFGLGLSLAVLGSDDQSNFLHGMEYGFSTLGFGQADSQLLYLASEIKDSSVPDMLRNILGFIDEQEQA